MKYLPTAHIMLLFISLLFFLVQILMERLQLSSFSFRLISCSSGLDRGLYSREKALEESGVLYLADCYTRARNESADTKVIYSLLISHVTLSLVCLPSLDCHRVHPWLTLLSITAQFNIYYGLHECTHKSLTGSEVLSYFAYVTLMCAYVGQPVVVAASRSDHLLSGITALVD